MKTARGQIRYLTMRMDTFHFIDWYPPMIPLVRLITMEQQDGGKTQISFKAKKVLAMKTMFKWQERYPSITFIEYPPLCNGFISKEGKMFKNPLSRQKKQDSAKENDNISQQGTTERARPLKESPVCNGKRNLDVTFKSRKIL